MRDTRTPVDLRQSKARIAAESRVQRHDRVPALEPVEGWAAGAFWRARRYR